VKSRGEILQNYLTTFVDSEAGHQAEGRGDRG
jgi:hypothetical protein